MRGSARGSIGHSSLPRNARVPPGRAGAPRLAGMAKPPPSAYLGAMRRLASIALLLALWLVSLAALALGLDSIEHPPFVPYALISGAYFGALSAVSLAEEIAEALGRSRGIGQRHCLVPARGGAKVSAPTDGG